MKRKKCKRILSRALAMVIMVGAIAFVSQGANEVQAGTRSIMSVNLGVAGIDNPRSIGDDVTLELLPLFIIPNN